MLYVMDLMDDEPLEDSLETLEQMWVRGVLFLDNSELESYQGEDALKHLGLLIANLSGKDLLIGNDAEEVYRKQWIKAFSKFAKVSKEVAEQNYIWPEVSTLCAPAHVIRRLANAEAYRDYRQGVELRKHYEAQQKAEATA